MPTLALEWAARAESGRLLIAGLDEAGRGALAGPVVAGAVILDLDSPDQVEALQSVDDSKRLSAASREHNLSLILQHAVAVGIGCVPASQIDQIGIIAATKEAASTPEPRRPSRPTPTTWPDCWCPSPLAGDAFLLLGHWRGSEPHGARAEPSERKRGASGLELFD